MCMYKNHNNKRKKGQSPALIMIIKWVHTLTGKQDFLWWTQVFNIFNERRHSWTNFFLKLTLLYLSLSDCSTGSTSLTQLLKRRQLIWFPLKKNEFLGHWWRKTVAFAWDADTAISGGGTSKMEMWRRHYCFTTHACHSFKNLFPETVQRLTVPEHMTHSGWAMIAP